MTNNSPHFYDAFVSHYDVMISNERYQRILPFFKKIIDENNAKSVLDCACGTGKYTIAFSKLGLNVEGSDLSSEMVSLAKRNAAASDANIPFVQADFKKLPEVFDRKFDCVVCIGNSLTHELEDQGVVSALKSMYNVLNDNGVIMVQIRNIPKLVKDKTRIFPIHHHKEPNGDLKLFIYVLDFFPNKITFNVVSYVENDAIPKFDVNSVDYNPLSENKLASLMTKAGFRDLRTYGSFEFTPFEEQKSADIIIVGKKI
ncbi:MAG: class I SAM-dependent methyltransferase [Candidatus Bathyarchaeia archaeon]